MAQFMIKDRIKLLPKYRIQRITDPDTGVRFYKTPNGDKCDSVTTILSNSKDTSALDDWRENMGEERANQIVNLAIARGEGTHLNIENYLKYGILPPFCFHKTAYWKSIFPFVKTVEKALLLEASVWHTSGYAGSFDCLAYLPDDGEQPSLLDWKTANNFCKPDKIYEYKLQVAAYVAAANEVYKQFGLNIQRAFIVVAIPDEECQVVELHAEELKQCHLHFLARLQRFTFSRKRK